MRLSARALALFSLGLAGAVLFLHAHPAFAQSSLGIGTAEVTARPSGPFAPLTVWIAGVQRSFFTDLRHALVAMRNGQGGGFFWLVGLSFVYGIFHAAGPGHGKAVISSYMLANEVELRRGVVLSFASALLQGVAALLLVAVGWYVLRGTGISMTEVGTGLELASYATIALFGVWLLARKLVRVVRRRPLRLFSARPAPGGLAFAAPGAFDTALPAAGAARAPLMAPASGGFSADICDDPAGDACECGRAHIADPRLLGGQRLFSRSALSAALAVGLRPCSGAIVVLTFALTNGILLGGVLSVFAMALGTAITVSVLASLAVFAKDVALRAGRRGRIGTLVADAVEIGGAALLTLFGIALLAAALGA